MIIHTNNLPIFADSVMTRGRRYQLLRRCSGVNANKHFNVNRELIATPSVTVGLFRRMLDTVDFAPFCMF